MADRGLPLYPLFPSFDDQPEPPAEPPSERPDHPSNDERDPRAQRPPAGTRQRPFTVTQANTAARDLLEREMGDVWIQGEITNFKSHGSGHFYFTLKDARCQVSAVMFRSVNLLLRFKPGDGVSVAARGRLSIYESRGGYQINVQWMEPLGAGSLQAAFEQLKAKLRAEGLFDPDRKRVPPALPVRIALVTSPTGAAISDILRVLKRRHAGLSVIVAPCRVQGAGAAAEIAAAVRLVNDVSARGGLYRVDVMIVGRGGGSIEDLWAFNEEIVARAIALSGVPVISAVGHEVDVTIADLVADLRAPTPSAAAEMVVKSREELLSRVEGARSRLAQAARVAVLSRRRRVDALARSRAFTRVEGSVAASRQRSDEALMRLGNASLRCLQSLSERVRLAAERMSPRGLRAQVMARRDRLKAGSDRLGRAMGSRLRAARERSASGEALLRSLSPLAVLDRGYAICQDAASGAVITDAAAVSPGDEVRVRLSRGGLAARVTTRQTTEKP